MTYLNNLPRTAGQVWTALHRHAFRGCAEIGPIDADPACPLEGYEGGLCGNLPCNAQRSYAIRAHKPTFLLNGVD